MIPKVPIRVGPDAVTISMDGGFLVLNASDMLMEPGTWKVLKRALMFGEFDIQNPDSGQSPLVLRPWRQFWIIRRRSRHPW